MGEKEKSLDFLKSTKGGPFGSAGGQIPEGKGRPRHHSPLKSAPDFYYSKSRKRALVCNNEQLDLHFLKPTLKLLNFFTNKVTVQIVRTNWDVANTFCLHI